MSQFVIYVSLPKYLSEWLVAKLGNPVVFPPSSPQNAIIRAFTKELPKGQIPELASGDETAIAIPDSVSKPPMKFNHVTQKGKEAIAEACKDLFKRALWADMSPLVDFPVGLNKLIEAWCETNGIGIDRAETVRQCFYRIRKDYAQSGINLRNSSRKK